MLTRTLIYSFARLFSQLEAGRISQEEYDELTGGISEEQYLAELELEKQEEAPMSREAQKVYNGMRSESGVEFAPWMKVDAEAIAKAKQEREQRKARQAQAALKSDSMLIDPQAAELGGGCTRARAPRRPATRRAPPPPRPQPTALPPGVRARPPHPLMSWMMRDAHVRGMFLPHHSWPVAPRCARRASRTCARSPPMLIRARTSRARPTAAPPPARARAARDPRGGDEGVGGGGRMPPGRKRRA